MGLQVTLHLLPPMGSSTEVKARPCGRAFDDVGDSDFGFKSSRSSYQKGKASLALLGTPFLFGAGDRT